MTHLETLSFLILFFIITQGTMASPKKGSLEVICGPLCSGKSAYLIKKLNNAKLKKKKVMGFKYTNDKEDHYGYISSRNGASFPALITTDPQSILKSAQEMDVIGIDEIQFFDCNIVGIIDTFIKRGKAVVVSGLDLDFRRIPFKHMPLLLTLAEKVTKLKAICSSCHKRKAMLGQRLINNMPAQFTLPDPTLNLCENECYKPRCYSCFEIDHAIDYTELANEYDILYKKILKNNNTV